MTRARRPVAERDPGISLVEVVIAVVLSGILAGVIVSSLVTSLNAAGTASSTVTDATDVSLVSTYLARDAQASAGVDPTTARVERLARVAVPAGGGDWGGCEQDGSMVVRFSWIDRAVSVDSPVTVSWSLHPDGRLVRRSCEGATPVDLVLGSWVGGAEARCEPDPNCDGSPDSVELVLTSRSGAVSTMYASLRGDLQEPPTVASAAPVPLVVLGEQRSTGACPVLDLAGTGTVTVLGGAVVSASCGASPIAGDLRLLATGGRTSVLSRVGDPYGRVVPPVDACPAPAASQPAVGASPTPTSTVVHTERVTVSGSVVFAPGRHVFCAGLTIAPGATVAGTGVLWYLPTGGLSIDPSATIDLTAATGGDYANLLLWVGGTATTTLGTGTIDTFRGVVYVPMGRVTLATSTAVHVGGVVAANVVVSGSGAPRLGMPIPTVAVPTIVLPVGQVGVTYPTTSFAPSGGTAPYRITPGGLPAGLVISPVGLLSGTPTVAGAFTVDVLVVDATGVHARSAYTLVVRDPLVVSGPSSVANGQAGVAYPATTVTATGGLAPYTWTARGLPAGMSLTSGGQLRGTPSAAGRFTFEVAVTDAATAVATRSYTFDVAPNSTASDPFAAALGFQFVAERDAVLATWGVDGAVAVGGNLVFRNYQRLAGSQVSNLQRAGASVGLVVGGTIDLASSGPGSELTVANGLLHVGALGAAQVTAWDPAVHLAPSGVADNWSTPRVIVPSGQVDQVTNPVVLPGALDVAATFDQLRASAASIGALDPATCSAVSAPTVTEQFGNHTLTLVPDRVNVWNTTIAQITAMSNVSGPRAPGPANPLVINVLDGGALTLPVRYWSVLQSGVRSSILWNFPNATAVNVRSSFQGSMLAPLAAVRVDDVSIEGDVVAAWLEVNGGNHRPARWTTPIPCTLGALSVFGPAAIGDGQVGVAMSATAQSSGGSPPYTWSATGLPSGVTLSGAGVLSGTPTTAGSTTVVVTVTDATGARASRSYPVTIRPALAVATPNALPAGVVGTAYPTTAFTASGGLAPVTWSATGLPSGLTLSSGGQLTGTPAANGPFTVVVTARDAAGATATRSYPMTVTGAVCPTTFTGWRGEYFDNPDLRGPAVLCRNDASIDFFWGGGRPDPSLPAEQFSVRWTRTQSFAAGTYRFEAAADDGVRLIVNGTPVIDQWIVQPHTSYVAFVDLRAGANTIVMETYENFGDASATLSWSPLVNASCPAANPDRWTMEIFDGMALAPPVIDCRSVNRIDDDWGTGTPDSRVGGDTFSIRWSRTTRFDAGTYQFTAGSDDGVRVYVDGVLVIDQWRARAYGTNTATINLSSGNHNVVMEYYEQGGVARALLTWRRI